MLILRKPKESDEKAVLDMLDEFWHEKSALDGSGTISELNYADWLRLNEENEQGINLPTGFVPAIQYVLFDENDSAVGFLQLRLRLNEYLREKGGHIGYSIRPSQRQKGYAKEQLRQGLQKASEKNIKEVLITCHADNEASRRTILSVGGRYESTLDQIERYWVKTDRTDER